jgi:hypothetical protein
MLYSSNPTNAERESLQKPSPGPRALRVWVRLREIYGDRFTREFGSVPSESWAAAIERMPDAEVVASLRALAEKGSPHPPTLGEFVKAAKPETGSPRYLGANPINYTEARIAGLLPQPEKKHFDMEALRKCLKG